MLKHALTVEDSRNRKLGRCSATYLRVGPTCPSSCPLLNAGCYAQRDFTGGFVANRLTQDTDPLTAAKAEAQGIDQLSGRRPLRLHVSGDARTRKAARRIAAACRRYVAKLGSPVWGYTHAWRNVERSDWRGVSMLASVDNLVDAELARRRGYVPAMVVGNFDLETAIPMTQELTGIPCPQQTRGITCDRCRLCFRDDRLRDRGRMILFRRH